MDDNNQQLVTLLQRARQQLASYQQSLTENIAIMGMACRFPGANTLNQFWQNLCAAKCSTSPPPPERYFSQELCDQGFLAGFIENVFHFDAEFFDISQQEALYMDPQQRLMLQTAYQALWDAGYFQNGLALPEKTGIFVGVSGSDHANLCLSDRVPITPYNITGNSLNAIAGRLAYILGVHGPAFAIDSACSSSLVAVDIAVQLLRARQIDLAIVGGVNLLLNDISTQALLKTTVLSPTSCCLPFTNQANGMVRGEGCGVVILSRQSDVIASKQHAYAMVLASGVNQDGKSVQLTAPNGLAQQQLLSQVLTSAQLQPQDLTYVETHGTGTTLGDPLELHALNAVLAKRIQPLYIGSVKANIGHLEAASGIAGFIKSALILHQQLIPPSIVEGPLTHQFDWRNSSLTVTTESIQLSEANINRQSHRVGVSSFGFSGTNAHAILATADNKISKPSTLRQPISFNEKEYRLSVAVTLPESKLVVAPASVVPAYIEAWVPCGGHEFVSKNPVTTRVGLICLPEMEVAPTLLLALKQRYACTQLIVYSNFSNIANPIAAFKQNYPAANYEVVLMLPDLIEGNFHIHEMLILVKSLYVLLQTLGKWAQTASFSLLLISTKAQLVLQTEHSENILIGALYSLVHTFSAEYPNIVTKHVDLASYQICDNLIHMLDYAWEEDLFTIAERKGVYYSKQIRHYQFSPSVYKSNTEHSGTYLITGGNGDIGRLLLEHLALRGAKHLFSLSRQPLDEVFITAFTQRHTTCTLVSVTCDVTDEYQLSTVIQSIKSEAGPIVGVYHLAGEIKDALIAGQSAEELIHVIKAKLLGAWYLHQYTLQEPVKEFILFSSACTFFAGPGQCAYRFANTFLNQLTDYRRVQGLPAISIAWGAWEQTQAIQSPAVKQNLARVGMRPIPASQGLAAMTKIITTQANVSIGLFDINWQQLLSMFPEKQAQHFYFSAINSNTVKLPLSTLTDITARIVTHIQTILPGHDKVTIDSDMPLETYGLDSISVIELTELLAKEFSCKLPTGFLYSYPTVAAITEYFKAYMAHDDRLATNRYTAKRKPKQNNHSAADGIAIIGIGCRFPGNIETPVQFWECLLENRKLISVNQRAGWLSHLLEHSDSAQYPYISQMGLIENYDFFDAAFFNLSPREAACMDPQQRIVLETAAQALQDAGISFDNGSNRQGGIFIGAGTSDFPHVLQKNQTDGDTLIATGSASSILAGRLAYWLNWHGPTMVIDTACSSSLVAVHQASLALKNGECDIALVGGVNLILSPITSLMLAKSQALSVSGRCAPFTVDADGYVRAEGCAFVVLKSLQRAEQDQDNVYAIIQGSAINQDGRSQGITAPNGLAQEAVMHQALIEASVHPEQVSYIEAHGTGTLIGDQIEMGSIFSVYGALRTAQTPLVVGSLKANLGHTESAAGIASLIKSALMLHYQTLLPHSDAHKLNEKCAIHNELGERVIQLLDKAKRWNTPREQGYIGISSFGFSGTNVHAILAAATKAWQNKLKPALNSFQRKRYPIPGYDLDLARYLQAPVLLPNNTSIYQLRFTDHYPFQLQDHQLYTQVVVPGAFYLLALIHCFGRNQPEFFTPHKCTKNQLTLKNIRFESPLVMSPADKGTLQLHISPKQFKVYSSLESRDSTAMHCVGDWDGHVKDDEVGTAATQLFSKFLQDLHSNCGVQNEESSLAYYDFLEKQEVHLGPAFQNIRRIWREAQAVITKIETHETDLAMSAGSLDSVFQTIGLLLPYTNLQSGVRIPIAIDKMLIYQTPKVPCYTLTFLNYTESSDIHLGNHLSHDIHVFSESGEILLSIRGFKTFLVSRQTILNHLPIKPLVDTYYWCWKPITVLPNANEELNTNVIVCKTGTRSEDPIQTLQQELAKAIHQVIQNSQCQRHTTLVLFAPQQDNLATEHLFLPAYVEFLYSLLSQLTQISLDFLKIIVVSPVYIHKATQHSCGSLVSLLLLGCFKTLSLEHPEFNWCWYDDETISPDLPISHLQFIKHTPKKEPVLSCREGQYFVPRLKRLPLATVEPYMILPNACYVLVGGTSQIAQSLIPQLLNANANKIAVIQRNPSTVSEVSNPLIQTYTCDATNLPALTATFAQIEQDLGHIAAVFHFIGVSADGLMRSQTQEKYTAAILPKVQSAWHLHNILQDHFNTHLVLFSSAAAIFGGLGQGAYAGANQYLHGLATLRRSLKLPTTVIAWGDWLTATHKHHQLKTAHIGMQPFTPRQAFNTLLRSMSCWSSNQVPEAAFMLQPEIFSNSAARRLLSNEFNELWETEQALSDLQSSDAVSKLTKLPIFARITEVENSLILLISKILSTDISLITSQTNLATLGIESIIAMEIRQAIYDQYQILMPVASLFQEQTIAAFAESVLQALELSHEINTGNVVDNIDIKDAIMELKSLLDEA